VTVTPNGSGNSFGLTLYKNGNSNLPTASCTASGSSGGGTSGGGTSGGGTSGGGTSSGCTVSLTKSSDWSDRFNVSATVSGSSAWTVKVNLGSGQSLQNSWNASFSTSGSTLTVTPNGAGNSFGFTLYKNGNGNLPTATCTT
jgi:endo-1,4-beta-xylanase